MRTAVKEVPIIIKSGQNIIKGKYDKLRNLSKNIEHPIDEVETYLKRAKAKGASPEELDVTIINGNNLEELEQVLPKMMERASDSKPGTLEYADDMLYLREEFPKIIEGEDAMGWPDYKLVHVNPEADIVKAHPKLVTSHEMEHAVHIPLETLPSRTVTDELLNAGTDYFSFRNSAEIGARISLIWNKLGITNPSKINGLTLKQLFESYLNIPGILDNEIKYLYNNVLDWDKLAKWASNPKNVYSGIRISIPSYLTYVNQQEQ